MKVGKCKDGTLHLVEQKTLYARSPSGVPKTRCSKTHYSLCGKWEGKPTEHPDGHAGMWCGACLLREVRIAPLQVAKRELRNLRAWCAEEHQRLTVILENLDKETTV